MNYSNKLIGLSVISLLSLSQIANADGDATLGENIFAKCAGCHAIKEPKNRVGPHLVGLVGRPIASIADFKYSDDMKTYASAAGTWDEENLNTYLENPKAVVPKTKMAFPGLKDENDRKNLIAYLMTFK